MSKEQYSDLPAGFSVYSDIPAGFSVAAESAAPGKSDAITTFESADYVKGARGYILNPRNKNAKTNGSLNVLDTSTGKSYQIEMDSKTPAALVPGLIEGHIRSKNQPTPMSFLDSMKTMIRNDPAANVLAGAAKDTASTGMNLLDMVRKNSGYVPPLVPIDKSAADKYLKPEGLAQNIGAGLSTAAQFAIPSELAAKVPEIAKAGLAARAAAQAGIAGSVSTARGNDTETAAKDALLSGGFTALFGLLGKAAAPLGERIELSLLKPVKSDLQGVKSAPEVAPQTLVKNVYKYELGGTLVQSYEKAQALTRDLGNRMRAVLAANPSADVDLLDVLSDTSNELKAAKASNFGTNANIDKAVDNLLSEIHNVSPSGKVNLADAQDVKQALGYMGSWQNGARDADSAAVETVANAMYTKLKNAIETASGQSAEVKAINQQFGDVIPIKNALIRRIPVAARREPVSLKEFIALTTGGASGIGLAASDRLLRSGTAANALVGLGQNPIQNAAKAAPLIPAVADRLRSRMNP